MAYQFTMKRVGYLMDPARGARQESSGPGKREDDLRPRAPEDSVPGRNRGCERIGETNPNCDSAGDSPRLVLARGCCERCTPESRFGKPPAVRRPKAVGK